MEPIWCVMPILANWPLTCAAISDLLAQSVPTRLLLINQGADDAIRRELEKLAEAEPDRVLVWSHDPPLPSLSATWNRALDFVWACGGNYALVVNNDVRLHPATAAILSETLITNQALFVSAVGVTESQFKEHYLVAPMGAVDLQARLIRKQEKSGPPRACRSTAPIGATK